MTADQAAPFLTFTHGVPCTADATVLNPPITDIASPARTRNYSSNANTADNWLVYICDVNTDLNDHPVILYIIAKDHRRRPHRADRKWMGSSPLSGSA